MKKAGAGNSHEYAYKIFTSQKKVIVYFVIMVIVISVAFISVFFSLYASNIRQIVIRESGSGVRKTNEFLDRTIESLEYIADIAQNNLSIQKVLSTYADDPATRYMNYRETIENIQGIASNSSGSVGSVDIFINRDDNLITSDYGLFSDLNQADIAYFENLQDVSVPFLLTDTYRKKLGFMIDRNYEQITLVRPLYLLSEGVNAGVVAINIDKYDLNALIRGNGSSAGMIVDESNHILVESLPDDTSFPSTVIEAANVLVTGDEGIASIKLENCEYIIVYGRSAYTGWRYVSIIPANTTTAQMTGLRDAILLLFLILITISAVLLILLMSRKVYHRLRKLVLSMEEVEQGNLNVSISHSEHDEFGFMYTSFNHMVTKIRSLFEELYEQKLLQKEAELKLLQAKINPHFIYNIFDNMNWLIQLERYEELEKLVDSVSSYYKRSLNAGKDFITAADTLLQLQDYIGIQKIRFRNRFECGFDFDPEIMETLIPNHMLQPLLENAICHGIEPKTEKGNIFVRGIRIEDRIFFTVEDDGVGINNKKLQDIISFLGGEKAETENYFAIANINRRIKILYGPEYGLAVKSSEGAGTKVTVFIPAKSGRGMEVS